MGRDNTKIEYLLHIFLGGPMAAYFLHFFLGGPMAAYFPWWAKRLDNTDGTDFPRAVENPLSAG